jgi:hypothetical protein
MIPLDGSIPAVLLIWIQTIAEMDPGYETGGYARVLLL